MQSIITRCVSNNFNVSFLTAASESEHKADLSTLGVDTYSVALNCSSFNTLIEKLKPDVVIFDRYMTEEQFSWRVRESCPDAVRILNTEDMHSLRQARHDAVKRCGDAKYAALNSELAQREIAAILRSDLTLIISESEMALLTEHYGVPKSQLYYHPLVVGPTPSYSTTFEERAHFIHIGNFRHAPNWDAVLHLKQTLWPAIKKALPHAELHIYGAYPPKKATQLHNDKQGFLVKGWAEDVTSLMASAKVLIAPLRFGAGIKGKLLDAMRCSTPSITTWVGIEGIISTSKNDRTECSSQTDLWPGAVCSTDITKPEVIEDYVNQAVSLYTNKDVWESASLQAKNTLDIFSAKQPNIALTDKMISLKKEIDGHRKTLFMQSLLWHQTLNASKYMSQWIEAKNK